MFLTYFNTFQLMIVSSGACFAQQFQTNDDERIEWLIHTLLNHHFECIHMIEISSLFFVVARKIKMKVLLHKNQHLQY
jgi:hypothetical protein